ncbi:MAG TPA: choice-of-anchor tandem repeat GloVer-containing protein [Verrucomicrobiae bacterium]|nr:choice-of-anchor tandem repeat GloVer-containing protein [Verrucomicrobiae bacterium]
MELLIIGLLVIPMASFAAGTGAPATAGGTQSVAPGQSSGLVADNQTSPSPHTIMHPNAATRLKWYQARQATPTAPMAAPEALFAPSGTLSLLSYLDYIPSQRDQGYCGDCWCWAGTGCMEILLDKQNGIFDRLSVQEANSCEPPINGVACCDGGWLGDVATFYSASGYQRAVPWSNPGASWQDVYAACATSCSSITATPNYPVQSITANSISTYGVGQAQAIANIKAVLNQNIPVAFAFYLSTGTDWTTFDNFWEYQSESTTVNFDFACGQTYDENSGGGHEVLCVGYNDSNPNDPYWIMVNSWGTTSGRPNGIFHVCMTNNYNCTYYYDGYSYPSYAWEYLSITYSAPPQLSVNPTSLSPSIAQGQNATNQSFAVWNSGGGTANYTISTNASWLSVSPTAGSTSSGTNTHIIAYSTAGLATGSYSALITISSTNTFNSQSITVSLTVNSACTSSYAIATSSSPVVGGTTSGGGIVICGSNVTVCATPSACYNFVSWIDQNSNIISSSSCYAFTAASNRTLVATFAPVTSCTITTSSSPAAGGSTSGGGVVACGSNVTLCATPNSCYNFVNWIDQNGSSVSSSPCFEFTAGSNRILVATFVPVSFYTVSTSGSPTAGGTTSGGGRISCGSKTTVCATPNACYNFVNWTDQYSNQLSASACFTFSPSANESLVANFALNNAPIGGSLTSLWSFTSGNDGADPESVLLQGNDGNFYGTTYGSGSGGCAYGAVFRISPTGSLTNLWRFTGALDGADPGAGLIQGSDGNFYGTTYQGGANGFGTVFRITSTGTLTTLWSFTNGLDGANSYAPLVQGSNGYYYGTTYGSGTGPSPVGGVFRISSTGSLTVLHSFSSGDGANPGAGLIQGSDGNFYGTTYQGGANGFGTVFRITSTGTLTTLWSFTNGLDGANSYAALVQGSDTNLYGTTSGSGSGPSPYGTVFRITSGGILTNLWSFSGCSDGAAPYAGLTPGTGGSFYGTTAGSGSGPSSSGTVFQIASTGGLEVLHMFGGSDGANPYATIVQGTDGNLYGTAYQGGTNGYGTVFRLSVTSSCNFSISPTNAAFGSAGGSGSANVTASSGACAWTASTTNSFLTITTSTNGSGNGSISYIVAINSNCSARTGALLIAGQTVMVIQASGDSVGDGIPDWWRKQYFSGSGDATNSFSCVACDADGTGQNNLFKYVTGLDPTNHALVFTLQIAKVTGQPGQNNLFFAPLALGRTYTLLFSTNLPSHVWLPVTTYTGPITNGNQVFITDTNSISPQEFYRVNISLP